MLQFVKSCVDPGNGYAAVGLCSMRSRPEIAHFVVWPWADNLALEEESKILGRCWDVLKVVTGLQSSLWASPHRPTQCSKTGLKMSDWKCEILTEPSNGQESYSPPLEQGYLVRCLTHIARNHVVSLTVEPYSHHARAGRQTV